MIVYDIDDGFYIGCFFDALNDGQGAGQYAAGVANGYPYPLISYIQSQTARIEPRLV